MKPLSYFFCYRSRNKNTRKITREEDRDARDSSGYLITQTRAVGRSKSAGHAHWQPALSAISEDGASHAPGNEHQLDLNALCLKKSSTMKKDKARVKSRSIDTGSLYSWRFLLESSPTSSPSPFMF